MSLIPPSIARPCLRLLLFLFLLGASAFAPSALGEPSVWRTSHDLIKNASASFPPLDRAGIEAVIKRLPKSLLLIRDYLLDKDVSVRLHKGDLTIDGSFANAHVLVVDGNLTIRGSSSSCFCSMPLVTIDSEPNRRSRRWRQSKRHDRLHGAARLATSGEMHLSASRQAPPR